MPISYADSPVVRGTAEKGQWSKYFTEIFSLEDEPAPKPRPSEDSCQTNQAAFVQCLNTNTDSIVYCQGLIDALHDCRIQLPKSTQATPMKPLKYEAPSANTKQRLDAYQAGLLDFFDCVNANAHDIVNCQDMMDALRRSRAQR